MDGKSSESQSPIVCKIKNVIPPLTANFTVFLKFDLVMKHSVWYLVAVTDKDLGT